MSDGIDSGYLLVDLSSAEAIEKHAEKLRGMTFREVIDLGIVPEGVSREYNSKRYKGGMGTLIEERFFGYKANSVQGPDFEEAGVELKVTCFDVKKDGGIAAGERLVLTMIPFDSPIEDDFYESHVWEKSANIMLVYYERNRDIDSYDQVIRYTSLFTPPAEDLKIIEDDYKKIVRLIQEGHAEELSESMTTYLGACTKGSTAATMWVDQFYPPHSKAKKRAFCFKRQYMDFVLHHYIMRESSDSEAILSSVEELSEMSFEELVLSKIDPYMGKSDRELSCEFGIAYSGNKAQWTRITFAMLGLKGEKAEEFQKANISVRTIREEESGRVRESLSLNTISFLNLNDEEWEEAPLHEYFEETRFLFVVFRKQGGEYLLSGARFWSMPQEHIDGPLRDCWQRTQDVVRAGVELAVVPFGDSDRVENNLPKKSDNPVAHVRPHTSKAWYRFGDGSTRGDSPQFGDELPDGREMTKQSFWLNNDYIHSIISS